MYCVVAVKAAQFKHLRPHATCFVSLICVLIISLPSPQQHQQ